MTVAAYATDLTTMDQAESGTGWAEPTASGWTSLFSTSNGDTDDYIQNSACNMGSVKTGVGGYLYNNGSGITLNQDDAVLVWVKYDTTATLDSETNGGVRTVMGSALNAFYAFSHLGNDSYIYGGWVNLATGDPADTDVTADYTEGSPTTTKQYHGWAYNATAVPTKGYPFKVDAIRYGRCELEVTYGDATAYGTFTAMATYNDYNDATNGYNRFGLFQAIPGGYLWKGLISLGTSTTAVDFRDSNASINIDNTKHVTPAFNKIEVNNSGSRVDWTGVTITALGTVSKGRFEAIDDADINFDTCIFNDMDTFVFKANSTIVDSSFVRCGQITLGGGILSTSLVSESTAAIAVSTTDLEDLTNNHFIGDSTGHAVELTDLGDGSMDWDNTFDTTTYATVDGSTGNEAIYVNVGSGTLTINVDATATTPTIRTAGATVSVVAGSVPVSVTVKTSAGVVIENANVFLRAADAEGPFPYQESVTITNSGTTATVAHTGHGLASNDKVDIKGANESEYNGVKQITVTGVDAYTFVTEGSPTSPATGTITSTFVALEGLSSALGVVSTSRTYTSDQPVTGWARKSTSSPFYKQANINSDITSAAGFTTTVGLVSDE